ncbi:hypothetical protein Vafri_7941 [Volvox africanus]|uniref:Uncharacterized protein n=1 Tax=Volvox africanus TaxID=51714 RepID=A0A8J4B166_9CHLO|nr:hypothetical protein Vafri_7941 [Volvox africanus]
MKTHAYISSSHIYITGNACARTRTPLPSFLAFCQSPGPFMPIRSASHHITSHHITSHHITSHHITSHHITSHHITSHHITSHHITSHHITSHHITSHHII